MTETLASRLGWAEHKAYVPIAFAVTAFALGVQLALITEAIGAGTYPPAGKTTLAWVSGLVLVVSAIMHVPWARVQQAVEGSTKILEGSPIPSRSVHLAPYHETQFTQTLVPGDEAPANNGQADAGLGGEVTARVHSPLSAGPVVAPGEEMDFTIEAEPQELSHELDVQIEVHGPNGSRQMQVPMEGTQANHTLAFEDPGEFTVAIVLDHPRSEPVSKEIHGRVASYREEVGRLFETLKEQAAAAGLDVGPGSTPREVCHVLGEATEVKPTQLADLAVELEVALYGDEEVDRATYETVHGAIASTGLLEAEPSQEVRR